MIHNVSAVSCATAIVAFSALACRSSSSTVRTTVLSTASWTAAPVGAFNTQPGAQLSQAFPFPVYAEGAQPLPDARRFRQVADSAISSPAWSNSRWGILVIDADNWRHVVLERCEQAVHAGVQSETN